MALWEKRRSALVLAGLMAFHVLLISIQVPQGAEKSLFERGDLLRVLARPASGVRRPSGAIGSAWRNYFDLRGVRRENERLKREVFFLNQDIRFLEDRLRLSRSEAELRALLTEFRGTIVPARVIGIDSANPHQSIVIDKGSLDGVRKDMAVCDMTGALVGRTLGSVSLKEAVVQLITDKDSSVGVVSVRRPADGLPGRPVGPALRAPLRPGQRLRRAAGRGAPDDGLRQDLPGRPARRPHLQHREGRGLADLPPHPRRARTSGSTRSMSSPS